MTIIDTSVWIEFLRRSGDAGLKLTVRDLISTGAAAYTCPIRFELIHGARATELADLLTALNLAERVPLLAAHWDKSATLAADLRASGHTMPTPDILIASVAVARDFTLLTTDTHFQTLQKSVLPDLRLFPAI